MNSAPAQYDYQQPSNAMTSSVSQSGGASQLSLWQRLRQFQPSGRLVKLLLLWWFVLAIATAFEMTDGFGIDILASFTMPLHVLTLVSLALLVFFCVFDVVCLVALSQLDSYTVEREFPNNVPIYHDLTLAVYLSFTETHSRGLVHKILTISRHFGFINSIGLDFYDDYPDQLTLLESMPIRVELPLDYSNKDTTQRDNSHTVKIAYPVLPTTRGTGYFGVAHLRLLSPLQLFRRSISITEHSTDNPLNDRPSHQRNTHYLRVLADFSGLMTNQLSAVFERSVQAGVQALMQQGHGSDFLKLREYSAGDAIRQIDWKASSRLRRLMSKSYEDDNDQDVVFLLDCGEQMRHQDIVEDASDIDAELHADLLIQSGREGGSFDSHNRSSYFDQVLNAVLLLSYIANKQSDKVGLMTFGGPEVYLPPSKGVSLIRNMLNDTADIKPTMQTSDYLIAAQQLSKRLKKRSLVVLITNTRAEASEELMQAVQLLGRRHKVVIANLIEQAIFDRLHGDIIPTNMDDALLYHSLVNYEQSRQQLHQYLSQQTGAMCLQTTASKLPLTLTQAYLSLKRK